MRKYLLLPILLLFVYAPVVHAQSLDIPVEGYGISFGNSKNFTGLRFNLVDSEVEQINGFNLALLSVGANAEMNGISTGLIVGGDNSQLNGITLGAIILGESVNGIALGFSFAKNIKGIIFSEWAGWVMGSGYGMDPPNMSGIQLAFFGVAANKGYGISAAASHISNEMNGIAIGGVFNIVEEMNGLQIGLFNFAKELNGIQIGLINYAGNNPAWSRILPGINAHFSF
jgi:hypothetical protein